MKYSQWVLPIIVLSQFCCTSLWFAGNGVMAELATAFQFQASAQGHLTSAVQLGFIAGTLVFALLSLADRFPPSRVFFLSAFAAAFANACIILEANTLDSLLVLRACTGFFLAGIYPVGMKIAADYFKQGLGKSLGFLVGALVLGTAFPHLLRGYSLGLPWSYVILTTSALSLSGGLLMLLLVSNGPYRTPSKGVDLTAAASVFKVPAFRSAAFGYFGHMWELYAFWAFVPFILSTYQSLHPYQIFSIPLLSFAVIGIGGVACIASGYLSLKIGARATARLALLLSLGCCLLSPFAFLFEQAYLFMGFLLLWGWAVVADSPMLSTLVAQNAPPEHKGTALTIVNCLGFAITVLSIQLLSVLSEQWNPTYLYLLLAPGPLLGLVSLNAKKEG